MATLAEALAQIWAYTPEAEAQLGAAARKQTPASRVLIEMCKSLIAFLEFRGSHRH